MSTTELTGRQKAIALLVMMLALGAIIVVGLLLREYGPGNMGTGFLQGAAVGVIGVAIVAWRVTRSPDRATSFERAFTQQGDERDDVVLTRALAVLGLLAFPLTGAAAVAIGLGASVEMVLALLLIGQVLVGAVAYAVQSRRH
ncbi:hypothetical protein FNH13_09560 [Ornithinimicrobium ciconiae]|uniref:DUF2178 domain-containing protein n=1 Tax=Ornithinimicrobium ciconiae TaxID=2594265 RepID=A0A516GAM4_9MICO|nr:hypothetical protein [Ornithinimicrobium ciconiae]QDO88555.1 hypothetical protein FNH13_09560 [Ornithinimicrobium ciconiae]